MCCGTHGVTAGLAYPRRLLLLCEAHNVLLRHLLLRIQRLRLRKLTGCWRLTPIIDIASVLFSDLLAAREREGIS